MLMSVNFVIRFETILSISEMHVSWEIGLQFEIMLLSLSAFGIGIIVACRQQKGKYPMASKWLKNMVRVEYFLIFFSIENKESRRYPRIFCWALFE